MEGKYLVSCNEWFYAPDGKQYIAVWGEVIILDDNSTLGIKSNRNSTNWFAKVGSEDKHVIIAGCQIHYAVKCIIKPNIDDVEDWNIEAGNCIKTLRPTKIYIAE